MSYNSGKTSLDLNLSGGVNIEKKTVTLYQGYATGTLYTVPASHKARVISMYIEALGATGAGVLKLDAMEVLAVAAGVAHSSVLTFDYSAAPELAAGSTISMVESAGAIGCTVAVVEEDA